MADSDFKPFATAVGANVMSQAAWEVLAALATGFSSGTAESSQVNKVLRQAMFSSAVLMKYVADTLGTDSEDDGDLNAHVARFVSALSAGATNPSGVTAVRGAIAFNNAGVPATKVDIDADEVMLRDATGKLTRVLPSGAITCDTGVAGPAANGRDQAGAFGNSNHIYFYLIYKPSTATLATLASLTPPATFDGSTLPALYTSWAFTHSAYKDGSGTLLGHYLDGDRVSYDAQQQAITGGTSTAEAAVSVASIVPPVALDFDLHVNAQNTGGSSRDLSLRHKSLSDFVLLPAISTGLSDGRRETTIRMPNRGQQFYYKWSGAATTGLSAHVLSFRVPNGG